MVILDDLMIRQHLEEYPSEPMRDRMCAPGGFQLLLLEPREYLLKLWRDTVATTVSGISPKESVFLFLHSVFYHTSSRDFFSCVDLAHLRRCLSEKDLEIDLVITLVDDIYDAWRRLKEPGQLFSSTMDAVQATCDLLLLLYWRSMEILASARTAIDLGKRHFLISLKYPLSVLDDLIFSDKIPAYIAHPITEVRKLESGDSSDRAKAVRLKEEIQQLRDAFAHSRIAVPIFPTGIDELIFKEEGAKQPLPELLQHWPYGDPVNLLFVPPNTAVPEPFHLPKPKEPQAISLLLRHLAEVIGDQINSRDRTLVEQTEAIVAWRPYYNGHPSSGVDNEIRHRNKLIERQLCAREAKQCFMLSRWEDIGWFRVDSIYDLLLEQRATLPPQITRTSLRNCLQPVHRTLTFQKGELTRDELAKGADPSKTIKFPLPRANTGALRRPTTLAEEEAYMKGWSAIAGKANQYFPEFEFFATDVVIYDDRVTIGEFVHRVEEALKAKREGG